MEKIASCPRRGCRPTVDSAQDAPGPLRRAGGSILLGVGERIDLGFWTRVGERADLGLDGGIRISGEEEVTESSNRAYGVLLGIGLDWFPAQRVSVGGHLALEAAMTRRDPFGPADEVGGSRFGTRSSGIRLQLYF